MTSRGTAMEQNISYIELGVVSRALSYIDLRLMGHGERVASLWKNASVWRSYRRDRRAYEAASIYYFALLGFQLITIENGTVGIPSVVLSFSKAQPDIRRGFSRINSHSLPPKSTPSSNAPGNFAQYASCIALFTSDIVLPKNSASASVKNKPAPMQQCGFARSCAYFRDA